MDCPVCNHKDVPPFATVCPTCKSDVVAYALLDDIEESFVDTVKDKIAIEGDFKEMEKRTRLQLKNEGKKRGRLWFALLLFPLLFAWCAKKPLYKTEIQKEDNPVVRDSLELVKRELAMAKNKIKALESNADIYHLVKKGDRLEDIAEFYLKDREAWTAIHKINPHVKNPHVLSPGDTILIKRNLQW